MQPTTLPLEDARWLALTHRDASADDTFVYAVKTTGVFCRPSCGARTPLRKNVLLFDNASAAQIAGFRACKRCSPSGTSPAQLRAQQAAQMCELIAQSETPPSLATLAAHVGLSVFHAQRLFKSHTGLTPKTYARAHRAGAVRETLRQASTVTEAIYDAGFLAANHFYKGADQWLAMTPRAWRAGGAGESLSVATAACTLGLVLIAATPRGVCAVLLGDSREALVHELTQRYPRAAQHEASAQRATMIAAVVSAVDGTPNDALLPVDLQATAFQHRVWRALCEIPRGQTRTYSEIAIALGTPTAARAVAKACASNPLAVLIPCHRVVRQDQSLAGYRWGLARKSALLKREQNTCK
ncbi:MAG: bifunctional DNA-binding transcriptional regulator/O6-methylguanine-DNA methyltransferase Ada [Deltaproteobacteria bacterium]|nr:bifunctional DNA-binding transcriptional regulator/O6-methylguanine-DNA methyltransferase Ada [Deltaproteobacteria bacterium]